MGAAVCGRVGAGVGHGLHLQSSPHSQGQLITFKSPMSQGHIADELRNMFSSS